MAKVYDVRQVVLSVSGLLIDSGYGEGAFVKVMSAQRAFVVREGCDGEITRSKTNSRYKTLEVTLSPLSTGNTKLAALHLADKKTAGGAGIGPLMLKDRNGLALIVGKCWVGKEPDPEYGKEATDRVWEIDVEVDESFQGGT
jgi:hypothetical protein